MNDPFVHMLDGNRDAVFARDVDAFAALYDQDVHVFDMWGGWSLRGIAAWRRMAEGWFGSLGDERVRVTFDAPGLPEPTARMSMPLARAISAALGKVPIR